MIAKYSMLVLSAVFIVGVGSQAFSQGRLNNQSGDQIHMPRGSPPSGPRPTADGSGSTGGVPGGPEAGCGAKAAIILVPGHGCEPGGGPDGSPTKKPSCPRGKKSDGTCW